MSDNGDPFHLEEHFHSQDRKLHRKERKEASAKDRSKFKKSDQDQLKKLASRESCEMQTSLKRGRVLAITPDGILVDCDDHLFQCMLKGTLKRDKSHFKNLIAIGDFVHLLPKDDKEGTITHIEKRQSILSRADNLSRNKEQLIAVNIDQVLITVSVVLPPLKPFLVDRYIIAAKKGGMEPLIVINKIDLLKTPPSDIDSKLLEEDKTLYDQFLNTYRALNFSVFPVSTITGDGIEELKAAMHGKTSVFSGQSGVGKSSLINALLGSELTTGKVVEKTFKGSHTTSASSLLKVEGGGFCIDTPGIKSFGIWDVDQEEIQNYFSEIQKEASHCKYLDCSHQQEPGCAVKKAAEEGRISPLRFASYCALIASISKEHRHR
jgi:ribosome biogenesis GTPase